MATAVTVGAGLTRGQIADRERVSCGAAVTKSSW